MPLTCAKSVEIVLKPHPARMHHAAKNQDHNCTQRYSTRYGLRSSIPKKPVKPTRNTRNSNKVLMNINLDSLLASNCQKNAQKRQEEVVVVDSETETVTDDERNAPKKVDSGSNKANANEVVIEFTDELDETPNNETENIENNAMEVTETEIPTNETENIENNPMEVTETETPNKDNQTENIENNAMEVTKTETPNKDNKIKNMENNAVEVTETEEPKDNETENTENNAVEVTETEEPKDNKTENTENNGCGCS